MRARECLLAIVGVAGFLAISAGWLTWRLSDVSLPPIARGMLATFAEGDRIFRDRIQTGYPIGSPASQLMSDLNAQGFEITSHQSPKPSVGTLWRFNGCGESVWSVSWLTSDGRLTMVHGLYGANCL